MPALFALGTVRWNADGTLEIGFPAQPGDANLAYRKGELLTQAFLGANELTLSVDTGTDENDDAPDLR